MRFRLMLAVALSAVLVQGAQGGERRCARDHTNPMVTSEGFGIGSCAMRGPRYHVDDFAGWRVRGYVRHAGEGDPMVWDDNRWQTRLMGFSDVRNDLYDRRFRHEPAPGRVLIKRTIEVHVRLAPPIGETIRTPRSRPLDLRSGARVQSGSRFARARHSCPNGGVLVLAWSGYRERASCFTSGRSKSAPAKRSTVFPGRA